jgi:hypothetical protein
VDAEAPLAVEVQGPCLLTDGGTCATSPGYPTQNYKDREFCIISNVPAVPLQVVAFDVEFGGSTCPLDALTVNQEHFCGSDGPSGEVPADGQIHWSTDPVITASGWKICWAPQLP